MSRATRDALYTECIHAESRRTYASSDLAFPRTVSYACAVERQSAWPWGLWTAAVAVCSVGAAVALVIWR